MNSDELGRAAEEFLTDAQQAYARLQKRSRPAHRLSQSDLPWEEHREIIDSIGPGPLSKWSEDQWERYREALDDVALKIEDAQTRRDPRYIVNRVRSAVYHRDDGECVECGDTESLEFDHIIPHSKGGATSVENLQLLCRPCNRSKSNKI